MDTVLYDQKTLKNSNYATGTVGATGTAVATAVPIAGATGTAAATCVATVATAAQIGLKKEKIMNASGPITGKMWKEIKIKTRIYI